MPDISLTAADFTPTSSFTGGEAPTVLRGKNAIIRAAAGRAKIENYPGHLDIGENYNIASETLTGTLAWATGDDEIVGTGTTFLTQLHNGQEILADDEVFVVKRIIDDTHFLCDRPPASTDTGKTARYLPIFFEINRQRGVMRRGSAITIEKKDIIFAGDGLLHLNGTSTTFTATRRPKRLQRSSAGVYTEFPIGFDTVPPIPVITPATGGSKGMQAGKYSFMFSYWNSVTDGFSNPSPVVKKSGGAADEIVIVAGGRFEYDFTTTLAGMPSNANGLIVWGSQSGGGVAAVNESSFNQGPWLKVDEIYTGAFTIVDIDVDPATDKITNLIGHRFKTADSIFFSTTWGGITAGTEYFAIYVDTTTIKVATTAPLANAGTALNITADPGVGTHTVRRLDSSDKTFLEYLDADLGALASGDNNPPPDCEYVTEFANQVFCISALGNKTATRPFGTSPGNYVVPVKSNNKEAFPDEWRVSLGDEITGYANGVGRLFCLTPTGLPFVTPTGRTELARLSPTGLDAPFTSRPFWTKGGIGPYSVIVIQGDVFVYTGRTVLRSPSNADTNVTPFEIGLPVSDLTKEWFDGHVLLGHDPKNQQLCLISSATHRNDAGFWVSQILPYALQKNQWQPVVEVTSDTRDMIVSGVATIGGRMEFLAGGRAPSSAFTVSTFRYDESAGEPVPYYIAFTPSDLGNEQQQKSIKSFRVTGRVTDGIIQVHGARAGGEISIDDIENGTGSLSGNIPVPDSTGIERQFKIRHLVKGLQLASVRFAGEWDGIDDVDRLDEIVVEVDFHGIKQ